MDGYLYHLPQPSFLFIIKLKLETLYYIYNIMYNITPYNPLKVELSSCAYKTKHNMTAIYTYSFVYV